MARNPENSGPRPCDGDVGGLKITRWGQGDVSATAQQTAQQKVGYTGLARPAGTNT